MTCVKNIKINGKAMSKCKNSTCILKQFSKKKKKKKNVTSGHTVNMHTNCPHR